MLVMSQWMQFESTVTVATFTCCRRPFALLPPASCWNLSDASSRVESGSLEAVSFNLQ